MHLGFPLLHARYRAVDVSSFIANWKLAPCLNGDSRCCAACNARSHIDLVCGVVLCGVALVVECWALCPVYSFVCKCAGGQHSPRNKRRKGERGVQFRSPPGFAPGERPYPPAPVHHNTGQVTGNREQGTGNREQGN